MASIIAKTLAKQLLKRGAVKSRPVTAVTRVAKKKVKKVISKSLKKDPAIKKARDTTAAALKQIRYAKSKSKANKKMVSNTSRLVKAEKGGQKPATDAIKRHMKKKKK